MLRELSGDPSRKNGQIHFPSFQQTRRYLSGLVWEDRGHQRPKGEGVPRGQSHEGVVFHPCELIPSRWREAAGVGWGRGAETQAAEIGRTVYSRHGHSIDNKKVRHSGTFL